MSDRWRPNATVAAVICDAENRFLLVEERDAETNGPVLNQPAGHLEQGETLIEAVAREVLEETRWLACATGYLGVARYEARNGVTYLRHGFVCEAQREVLERSLDAGIIDTRWMTRDEILTSSVPPRSPLVLRAIDAYLAGAVMPLSFVIDD
ncbi:MAG: NUDIX domain-containing protein [Cellvibrionales bacterium]|nr:NUDIX domain-containing protein [Cellvibrionales bacterium]